MRAREGGGTGGVVKRKVDVCRIGTSCRPVLLHAVHGRCLAGMTACLRLHDIAR